MYGHVLPVYLTYEVLISLPPQLRDVVPLADVHQQLDEALVCLFRDRPRLALRAVGHLDGHSAVVVAPVGCAPARVSFLNVHADAPVAADAVVAAGFARLEHLPAALHAQVPRHAVDADSVDCMVSLAVGVRTELGVAHQLTVAHGLPPCRVSRCSACPSASSAHPPHTP
ncbi:hypothetical protein 2209_scaffold64_00047 [Bacteriophage sp.]|nr:hypothetical protein 2209_scaffold64_00047 [Bacteriophage sp.]